MKHITKETILIQGEKEFKPAEIDGVVYWMDRYITGFESNIWVVNTLSKRVWLWENTMALSKNNAPIKIVAQSRLKLEHLPVIDLKSNNNKLIIEGEYPIDLNAYTEKDIRKALDLARGNDFICLADGKDKLCHCRKDNECQHRHYKTNEEIISEVNKVESIEVDESFEIINFN